MVILYTFIFLTLFSLFSNSIQKEHLYFLRAKPYSQFIYPKYVHHKRPNRLLGLDLKALITAQSDSARLQEIFVKLIEHVYHEADFYTDDLAQKLLDLFQTRITFDKLKSENKDYHYVSDLTDLDTLAVPESLATIYPLLMNGCKLEEDHLSGFASLKTFLSISKMPSSSKINLAYTHPKLIETMFGENFAQAMAHFKEEYLASYKHNDKPLDSELETLFRTNTVESKFKDLVMLRFDRKQNSTSD